MSTHHILQKSYKTTQLSELYEQNTYKQYLYVTCIYSFNNISNIYYTNLMRLTSSLDVLPPELALGCSRVMELRSEKVSFCAKVMLALSCKPNISGVSLIGRLFMYFM